ncbi:MAG: cyclopropane-fatty-acyl-phospholipid synthase family protein [Acidobacteriota bacterium]|nr:cyclopropane-fatty-acyl-phospholipid synthase family protein [Acidobacteriota bacterium]
MRVSNYESTSMMTAANPGMLDRFARKTLLHLFENLSYGRLVLNEGDSVFTFGDEAEGIGLQAEIKVNDLAFYRRVLFGGSIGAAESYMAGEWDTPGLPSVVRLMSRNMQVVESMERGLVALVNPLRKLAHFFKRNTRKGSKNNISAHYDLSNEFFASFLDRTMMYSSAIFPHENASLEEASRFKLETICRKLDLGPNDHVVEIGTGWGGFAVYAVQHYGCKVTTTTISQEQYDFAKARIEAAGLEDRIELLLKDYRDLDGAYDKLVSIEMIEAVGHQFLDTYFEVCSRLLKPDGIMLIQAITMPDDRYESALQEVDFIKKYIFPGSFIPSVGAMVGAMARATDLRLVNLTDQTRHYAETLACWTRNFRANSGKVIDENFGEAFRRMWTYYFGYCEGGFRERVIGSAQLVFAKPLHREAPLSLKPQIVEA